MNINFCLINFCGEFINIMFRMSPHSIIYFAIISLAIQVVQNLTTAFNSCPNMETGGIQITDLPSSNFVAPRTTTVTFVNAQTNSSYQSLVTFQQFELSQAEMKISINIYISSKTTSSINVSVTGADSGVYIAILKVAYLVIPPRYSSEILAFTVDCCFTASCLYTLSQPVNTSFTLIKPFPSPLNNGSNLAVAFFNSVFLQTTNYPSNYFGQSIDVIILNTTHFTLNFTNVAEAQMTIGYYVVSVIAYRDPTPSLGIIITQNMTTRTIPTFVSTNAPNTFFGLYSFAVINGKINFSFNYIGNNTFNQTSGPDVTRARVRIITFSFGQCCAPTPYVDSSQTACIDLCPSTMYLENNMLKCCSYDCETCNTNISCLTCSSTDNRYFNPTTSHCYPIVNYYDAGNNVAAPCLYPHCCGINSIRFDQNLTCLDSCPKDYFFDSANNSCGICSPGYWAISNRCTNIKGCLATTIVNLTVACSVCDSSANYALSNNTCVCSKGYSLSTFSGTCKQLCGDGYHFYEQCDDGNSIVGDGCSSTCTVEVQFRFISSSSSEPSKCMFTGNNIQLSLNWANKIEGKNQAVFSFRVSAPNVNLNPVKLFLTYSFTSEPKPNSMSLVTTESEILLYADYDKDLEGNMALMSIQTNPDYVSNVRNISTSFRMSSLGAKLIVIHNYGTITMIHQIIEILAYLGIGIFLIASLTYKMIGVQILHSFLAVYFVCLETANKTELFMLFKSLQPINLNFIKESNNFYSKNALFTYSMYNEFISKGLLTAIMLLLLFLLCIMKIKTLIRPSKYSKHDSSLRLTQDQPAISKKAIKYSYNVIFFPLSIGFLHYSLFPAFLAQTSPQNIAYFRKHYQLIIRLKVFLTVICSIVYFNEFKAYFTDKKHYGSKSLKRGALYESAYIIFWLQVVMMFSINCFYKSNWLQEFLLLLYIPFTFFWFLRQRPYRKTIHNIGQLVNLITVIFFLSWAVTRKYFQQSRTEENEVFAICILLSLMLLGLLVTVVRTFWQFKGNCKSDTRPLNKSEGTNEKSHKNVKANQVQDVLELQNRYMLRNILYFKNLIEASFQEVANNRDNVKMLICHEESKGNQLRKYKKRQRK